MLDSNDISGLIPECCEIGVATIDEFLTEEQGQLIELLPTVKSIIVLGHHIRNSLEWVWASFDAERNKTTCIADLHLKSISENIISVLSGQGFKSSMIPYPGRCGILFKRLAKVAGMGDLGDSYLIIHPKWGPWIHLRAIVTEAEIINKKRISERACIHCGNCINACPSKAIGADDFNGMLCSDYQSRENKKLGIEGYSNKCEICARVCPIGEVPMKLRVVK